MKDERLNVNVVPPTEGHQKTSWQRSSLDELIQVLKSASATQDLGYEHVKLFEEFMRKILYKSSQESLHEKPRGVFEERQLSSESTKEQSQDLFAQSDMHFYLCGDLVGLLQVKRYLLQDDKTNETDRDIPPRATIDAALEKGSVEILYEVCAALVSGYAGLERKYDQLLALLVDDKLSVPGRLQGSHVHAPTLSKADSSGSKDKVVEREEPSSPLRQIQPSVQESMVVRIEVDEDPLTIEQMGVLFTTLTTLVTKYWLISQGRFADLIEFSKSHDERFVREAQAAITRISYNSPLKFDIKLSATDVAQGVVTTIDGIVQTGQRLKQMELATKTEELELQQAGQRFAEEIQRAQQQQAFEQEKQQLDLARQQLELERIRMEVEQQRFVLLESRLEMQRKSMDYAYDIAHKVIGQLHPQADDATKRMLIQTYVGDILQLSEISFKSVTVVEVDQTTTAAGK